jgi:Putative Flp pilus-assembly TadE/G-like
MRREREAGQTLVFVAFGMVMLGAILGLAIDLGYMRFLKRRIQTAADSAAIAGAGEIGYGDVTVAAKADSTSNGFTDGTNGVTVTVNNPPTSGPHQGVPGYVEVYISKTQPTFFIRIIPGGSTNSTVQARAVARSAKNCVYSLQPSPGNMHVTGSGLSAPNCAIIDNGDLNADAITASSISVGGTVTQCSSCAPTPRQGIVPAADPLAYLPNPTAPICNGGTTQTITGDTIVNPGPCTIKVGGNNCSFSPNVVFNPGTYGGVTICGGSNAVFNPGFYAFTNNGGLAINGNATVAGNGVTLYVTNNQGISITSTGTISLTAQTSGIYAGVLLYQDRNDPAAATVDGGNNPKFEGALYFPNLNARLRMNNIGSAAAYTILVAGSLRISGNNNILNSDYSSLSNVSPIRDGVLVE